MGEVERKVDMLISGIEIPKKKTRSRVVTLATTLIIASVLIASASLINVYYVQTGTVDVTSLLTITDPLDVTHDAGWEESVTIGGTGEAVFYEGTTDISEPYTIAYAGDELTTVYIHITITEELITDTPGVPTGDCEGLTVEVINDDGLATQFIFDPAEDPPIMSHTFTIHVTADPLIDASSTYGYIITMDLTGPNQP